jgi:hypothetical protein
MESFQDRRSVGPSGGDSLKEQFLGYFFTRLNDKKSLIPSISEHLFKEFE